MTWTEKEADRVGKAGVVWGMRTRDHHTSMISLPTTE